MKFLVSLYHSLSDVKMFHKAYTQRTVSHTDSLYTRKFGTHKCNDFYMIYIAESNGRVYKWVGGGGGGGGFSGGGVGFSVVVPENLPHTRILTEEYLLWTG